MPTATQVLIVSSIETKRLALASPKTLHEVRSIMTRAILNRGGKPSGLLFSLPHGSQTVIVNM